MKEYTEIEIIDSLINIDTILELKKYICFGFENNEFGLRFYGGRPRVKLNANTIKFLTQGYYEGVSLSEINLGTKLELRENRNRESKICDGIVKRRYFEKITKEDWKITDEINSLNCKVHQVEIELSSIEKECLEFGLSPLQMEDKWYSYVENNIIHYFRSWTGIEVFQSEILQLDNDKWIIKELRVTKNVNINFQDEKLLFERLVKSQVKRVKKLIL